MNTITKKILCVSVLASSFFQVHPYSKRNDVADALCVIGAAALVGGLCGLIYYADKAEKERIDRMPVEVIINDVECAISHNRWLLDDYSCYRNGGQLPLIINGHFPNVQYPTLTYYGYINTAVIELRDHIRLLERKKSHGDTSTRVAAGRELNYLLDAISNLEALRSLVYYSPAYTNEYKAQNPTTTVVHVHEHFHHQDGR